MEIQTLRKIDDKLSVRLALYLIAFGVWCLVCQNFFIISSKKASEIPEEVAVRIVNETIDVNGDVDADVNGYIEADVNGAIDAEVSGDISVW